LIKRDNAGGRRGNSGVAAVELALVLPLMLIIFLAIIDFARIFDARFVITNLAREGGSLASRNLQSTVLIITLLQKGAEPLDLKTSGKIYISQISAGATKANPNPVIAPPTTAGALSAASSIQATSPTLGLSATMYNHLVFNTTNSTADISGVTVVEVFYKYTPITPLSNFIPGLLTGSGGGIIIHSKAVFLSSQ
jgi:Flp pilus assembly protein TadG